MIKSCGGLSATRWTNCLGVDSVPFVGMAAVVAKVFVGLFSFFLVY